MGMKPRDIRVALVKRGLTGRQVAAAVGLSPSAFSRLVHGHRRADPILLEAIEKALKSPVILKDETTAGANEAPPAV
jgi:transcriptional regulator with XRE-family HTH domain